MSMTQTAVPASSERATLAISDIVGSRTLRTAFVLLLLWAGLATYPDTREAFLTASNLSNGSAQPLPGVAGRVANAEPPPEVDPADTRLEKRASRSPA